MSVMSSNSAYVVVASLIALLCALLTMYYVFLIREHEWSQLRFIEKTERLLFPLPAVVGLLAALSGLAATWYATSVPDARDNMREIRSTADVAVRLYTNVLSELDGLYLATLYFSNNMRLNRNNEDIQRSIEGIAEKLTAVRTALHAVVADGFANACFRSKWRDRGSDALTRSIAQMAVAELYLNEIYDDREIRDRIEERTGDDVGPLERLEMIVDPGDANVVHALMESVPAGDDMSGCLQRYYENDRVLREASRRHTVRFVPWDIAPLLRDRLRVENPPHSIPR